MAKIIVFGATGFVGSQVALKAHHLGAQVILAMRDTSVTIRGIPSSAEESGYERKYADLTKPDTVRAVVRETQAKGAFLYLVNGTPDHMKASIQALKDERVELVVFLSSFLLKDLDNVAETDLIAWAEAQVEKNLLKLFPNYVSLRPGSFATNVLRYKLGNEVQIHNPDTKRDFITHTDIGEVGANILVHGSQEQAVYLIGPEMISQHEAISTISRVFNKQMEVVPISAEENVKQIQQRGYSLAMAEYLTKGSGITDVYDNVLAEGLRNVEKYTGHAGSTFEAWVKANAYLFDGRF